MKKFLLGLIAAIALMTPFAVQKADAQVVVRVGPQRRGYYHHRGYYHRRYYHHRGYYHRY